MPPLTNTKPVGRVTARWLDRSVAIAAVGAQVDVVVENRSLEASGAPVGPSPPKTSTVPSGNRATWGRKRAVDRVPASSHRSGPGTNTRVEAVVPVGVRP